MRIIRFFCSDFSLHQKGVKIFGKIQAVRILAEGGCFRGTLAVNTDDLEGKNCGLPLSARSNAIVDALLNRTSNLAAESNILNLRGKTRFRMSDICAHIAKGRSSALSTMGSWTAGSFTSGVPGYISTQTNSRNHGACRPIKNRQPTDGMKPAK